MHSQMDGHTPRKKMYNLPEMGGGNSGKARKKTFFFQEVFPYLRIWGTYDQSGPVRLSRNFFFMSFHCIVWYCMVLYYILRYCMVLPCWVRRAGCISQDTYLLYPIDTARWKLSIPKIYSALCTEQRNIRSHVSSVLLVQASITLIISQ